MSTNVSLPFGSILPPILAIQVAEKNAPRLVMRICFYYFCWKFAVMKHPKFNNLGDRIFWAYANLSMLFATLNEEKTEYDQQSFMIRAKMFKGFRTGKMQIKSMFIDQHHKINFGNECAYCGKLSLNLALDHILPKIKGGKDTGDNLIKVCKSCNSSKKDKDLLEWSEQANILIDPWVLRNYLKLIYEYAKENNLLDKHREELDYSKLPFNPDFLPLDMPAPDEYFDFNVDC